MALVGNQSRINFGSGRSWGGLYSCTAGARRERGENAAINWQDGASTAIKLSAQPLGYIGGSAYYNAQTAGGLSSFNIAQIDLSTGAPTIAAGINIDGSATITFTVSDADLQLVVSTSGAATFTLTASADLVGALSGAGAASFAITTNSPLLGAIIDAVATATVTLTADGTMRATGALAGDITPFTELSPENLASAVWSASAAGNNDAGTMGEKLNDAGSGSNPWTEVIESGYTAAEILRVLAAVAAGKTTITDLGGGAATVTFVGIDGATDRVVADMTGSERATVTLDGT